MLGGCILRTVSAAGSHNGRVRLTAAGLSTRFPFQQSSHRTKFPPGVKTVRLIPLRYSWITLITAVAVCGPAVWSPAPITQSVWAQDEQDTDSETAEDTYRAPLVTINVASVNRVLGGVNYVFNKADRSEIAEMVTGMLSNVGNLKGLDRDKPFGMMLFLKTGLPPQPEPIGYIPVDNIADLMKTVEIGPVSMRKVDGDNRYELAGTDRTLHVLLQDGYAFVGNNPDLLDRKFPKPETVNSRLSTNYDIALNINLTTIPEAIKSVFVTFLKASSQSELQQRDGERDSAFRVRRANGESTLAFIEQLLTQCKSLTIGMRASETDKNAVFDINIHALEDSTFASYLTDLAGRQSYFSTLLDETTPFGMSVSWMMDKREKKSLLEILNVAETEISRGLNGRDNDDEDDEDQQAKAVKPVGALQDIFKSLKATAEAGHVDFFMQMEGKPTENFTLIGGARVAEGRRMASSLQSVLQLIQNRSEEATIELNASSHQGVTFHRIDLPNDDPEDSRLFGENAALFIGSSSKTIWFCLGGNSALPTMKSAIDRVLEDLSSPKERAPSAPFQIVANITRWLELNADTENRGRGRELAEQAFDKGGDTVRVDFRPTDSGARLRIHLDEGFLRFLGLAIANRYDRSQL